MKRVSYEAAPSENDEMGSTRRVKITIPAPENNSVEAAFKSNKSSNLELEHIFGELKFEDLEFRPRSAQEALAYASTCSDPNAEPLSEESYFFAVVQSLETVLNILDQMPERHRASVEQMINISFHAGSHFRTAMMRRKHLADIKREAGNAKGRALGGATRAKNYDDENSLLFQFMDEKLRSKTRFIRTAANWAAKQNLGAQKGTEEQRTEANRQRYLNYQKRRKGTKV